MAVSSEQDMIIFWRGVLLMGPNEGIMGGWCPIISRLVESCMELFQVPSSFTSTLHCRAPDRWVLGRK